MKYDVDGHLYLYLERNKKSRKVDSFIKLNDRNKLLRYDGASQERTFTKFNGECSLAHRFQAGESWVTVVQNNCNISEQYDFPKKKSLFSLKNNYVNLFTVSKCLIVRWASVLEIKPTIKTKTSKHNSSNVTFLSQISAMFKQF